ncbi:hypothetical protein Q8G47_29005, partial [Klebsiella pneumoniae]|uniref:hypothetical protein n=1 Tax=Klebsiella pneumoniae TaxID=573 RepID=UPI0030140274
STYVDEPLRRLVPTLPKDNKRNSDKEAGNKTDSSPVLTDFTNARPETNNSRHSGKSEVAENMESINESEKLCELTYGSYCLWRKE